MYPHKYYESAAGRRSGRFPGRFSRAICLCARSPWRRQRRLGRVRRPPAAADRARSGFRRRQIRATIAAGEITNRSRRPAAYPKNGYHGPASGGSRVPLGRSRLAVGRPGSMRSMARGEGSHPCGAFANAQAVRHARTGGPPPISRRWSRGPAWWARRAVTWRVGFAI